MTKRFLFILVMALVASTTFGQTTKAKLDEVKNDPKTTQNAAKADIQVADKKTVTDKATLKTLFAKKRKANAKKIKNLPRKTS
jgi:hypothetical protein